MLKAVGLDWSRVAHVNSYHRIILFGGFAVAIFIGLAVLAFCSL
jgi:hypothetical protein